MNKKIIILLALTSALLLSGCKKTTNEVNTPDTSEKVQNTETEPVTTTEKTESKAEFSFDDIKNYGFNYCSGAGGWMTELHINKDGSFYGEFQDLDAGETDEFYPKGIIYSCDYTGQFSDLEKIDENTYSMKIESIKYANAVDDASYLNGYKYVYSKPAGFDKADKVVLYLKGTPAKDLPENLIKWIKSTGYNGEDTLKSYAIYNEVDDAGFYGEDLGKPVEYANEVLKKAKAQSDEFSKSLEEDLPQLDMNYHAAGDYAVWDKALNRVWAILKNNYNGDEFEKIKAQQKIWIGERDKEMELAGKEYEGGSLQAFVECQRGSEVTKERVEELIKYLK